MAKIPKQVSDKIGLLSGLFLRGVGKVRDSYDLPNNKMLVIASDRCSIFDFVLNTLIPFKGQVLTALNYFWVTEVIKQVCENDMVACGADVDQYLPSEHRGNPDLQSRSTVVNIFSAPEVEDIVRLVLTGSGLQSYLKNGMVCGHKLPEGLKDGSLLPYPIYTPTTKAVEGHDLHITADSVVEKVGFRRERLALQIACLIAEYAARRGIRLADTKFEFSGYVLVDEKGTPDSSRFVDEKAWRKASAAGKFPASLDKQYVREWGKKLGIDKRDPEKPEDVDWVHAQVVPDDVIEMTSCIYRYIFWRLTGMKLEKFQREKMGINVRDRIPRIDMVFGSKSDLPQTDKGMRFLKVGINAPVRQSIISCHRNPKELDTFAATCDADIVFAGAGEAAALPGVLKALLCKYGKGHIPVIGVAFKGKDWKADLAARLSIENLPGQPVELDENGNAYFGPEGFEAACIAAINNEFLPKMNEAKPAELGAWMELI